MKYLAKLAKLYNKNNIVLFAGKYFYSFHAFLNGLPVFLYEVLVSGRDGLSSPFTTFSIFNDGLVFK